MISGGNRKPLNAEFGTSGTGRTRDRRINHCHPQTRASPNATVPLQARAHRECQQPFLHRPREFAHRDAHRIRHNDLAHRGARRVRMCAVVLVGAIVGATVVGSADTPVFAGTRAVVVTRAGSSCRVTPTAPGKVPEAAVSLAGSHKLVGSGSLWTLSRAARVTAAEWASYRLADGRYYVKFRWIRLQPGVLRITGNRIGGKGDFSAETHQEAYPPTGFLPSGLTFSTSGCWRVTGSMGTWHAVQARCLHQPRGT